MRSQVFFDRLLLDLAGSREEVQALWAAGPDPGCWPGVLLAAPVLDHSGNRTLACAAFRRAARPLKGRAGVAADFARAFHVSPERLVRSIATLCMGWDFEQ